MCPIQEFKIYSFRNDIVLKLNTQQSTWTNDKFFKLWTFKSAFDIPEVFFQQITWLNWRNFSSSFILCWWADFNFKKEWNQMLCTRNVHRCHFLFSWYCCNCAITLISHILTNMARTDGRADRRTDEPTDGQTLLKRCQRHLKMNCSNHIHVYIYSWQPI